MPRHLLATAAVAAVLYLPGLGAFGWWDPHEFDAMSAPLARAGFSLFGASELAGRLPFALAGIALALATYAWARGTRCPRDAFAVAALTAASPLVLLQSRQLTSSIAMSLGQLLIVLAASLLHRKRVRAAVATAIAGIAIVILVFDLPPAPAHPPERAWSAAVEHIAYGAFPWIALLPLARPRACFDHHVAILWSLASVAVSTAFAMRGAPVHFTAVPALALLATARVSGSRAGTFAAIAVAAVIARDLVAFPDRLAGLHVLSAVAHPETHGWVRIAPLLAVVLLATRVRVHACVAFGLVLAHAWTPAVSRNVSERHLFDHAATLRRPGESLVTLHVPERVARFYARDSTRAANQREVIAALASTARSFAIVPARALCQTSQAADALTVLESTDAFALVSNQHRPGEPRETGLDDVIRSEAPAIRRPLHAVFGDQLELLGVDLPDRVGRGAAFDVTLYFRVLARPTRKWKVFMHFEASGKRFQGDHWPIDDRCPTTAWNPGDIIVDTFTVPADRLGRARGSYALRMGLFVGANGTWTNMPVTTGDADDSHRVHAGTIHVR